MVEFTSSTFNGLESSEVLSAVIRISGGVTSSIDINVTITLTGLTAIG